MKVAFAPLGRHHDRAAFSCGQEALDDWFRNRATQDDKRNVARVFVAVDEDLGVVGFYSLSSFTVALENLPERLWKKLPRYEAIPAALIGRLARDVRMAGKGLGELLVADAIRRILSAGESLAVFAIVVDAKDESAVAFYKSFGFESVPSKPMRLFLPTQTAVAAFGVR